ncbi:MAG: formylglycine-generating enzyme family protein [Candidatus Accumulibacter sp.]|uniref:formylglycine-generating enzyme family protein n=1 Tax=Accumulibacter sp. TaxID=2053492 RepID=UPI001A4C7D79|nr:formylglycine-generating enzyme family protein [Accumulibacter sp.]MBL8394519.1 formylglycine-generating enzyme family protein [Accumulibacter sp.]
MSAPDLAESSFPDPFPLPWASDWGEDDEHGLWLGLTIGGVRQVFRWIAPGHFLMGSPAAEPERYEDEVEHEVTLSHGFWLAETACTQAFWQAVMGNNSSGFKDDPRNPVENVSWDDVQTFIGQLQQRLAGLPARLPSEAEWEYACRAGTTTPFSFGDNITPDLVNYAGNHPYAKGKEGFYRRQTVPVASLPANPWGLYEMHGNVLEWCADWYGEYPTDPQIDPVGARSGADRVLRGGSWRYDARDARSAYRYKDVQEYRYIHIGFRLALGQGLSAG